MKEIKAIKIQNKQISVFGAWLAALLLLGFLWFYLGGQALASDYQIERTNEKDYTIINTIEISNPGAETINNLKIEAVLPGKTLGSWQDYLGEEFNPMPDSITTDSQGRRIATYNIQTLSTGGSITLEQRCAVRNYQLNSSLDFSDYVYDPDDLGGLERYLQPEPGIESNNSSIIAYAKSKTEAYSNPYLKAKALFSDINLYMTYDNTVTDHSAVKALSTGRGNCVDYSYLYIASLRAIGIPARLYTGYSYDGSLDNSSTVIDGDSLLHNWVEFYVAGVGWLVADPTFEYYLNTGTDSIKLVDWSYFTNITGHRLITMCEGTISAQIHYSGAEPKVSYKHGLLPYNAVSVFSDIGKHWAKADIEALYNWYVPVVYDNPDGSFGVNTDITRAELVAMVNRVLDYYETVPSDQLDMNQFSDVSDSYWAAQDIAKAAARGVVTGYTDGTFRPTAKVSRAEMAAVLCRVAELTPGGSSPFTDLDANGVAWAKDYICALYQAGLTSGVTSTSYGPEQSMTKGEAASFIWRWISGEYAPEAAA